MIEEISQGHIKDNPLGSRNLAADNIVSQISNIAQTFVMAEIDDVRGLAELVLHFEDLAGEKPENCPPVLAGAARAAAHLTKKIANNESSDKAADLEIIANTLTAMQRIAEGESDPARIALPPGLGYQAPGAPEEPAGPGVSTPDFDDEIFAMFIAEQKTTLQELESHILSIEKEHNGEAMAAFRRLVHTLKGEAGVLGLIEISRLCHALEDYLDDAGSAISTDRLLAVKDWLAGAFDDYANRRPLSAKLDGILTVLQAPAPAPGSPEESASDDAGDAAEEIALDADPSLLADFITEAREHIEAVDTHLLALENDPTDEEALNAVFRAFHTIKGVAGFLNLEHIGNLAHQAETLLGGAQRGEHQLTGVRIDVIFDANDMLKNLIEGLGSIVSGGQASPIPPELPKMIEAIAAAIKGEDEKVEKVERVNGIDKKLGEILVDSGAIAEDDLAVALAEQAADPESIKLGGYLVRHDAVKSKDVAQALRLQRGELVDRRKHPADRRGKEAKVKPGPEDRRTGPPDRRQAKIRETVRVDTERLDLLIETIGELIIAESMVTQDPEIIDHVSDRVINNLRHLGKVSRDLQEMGTAMRMETLRGVFQKMARLVRDVAKKAGKKINFEIHGEDTELDRTVIDRIGDPLIHMVRNAADHGIEPPAERKSRGKQEEGRVQLRAFHQGGNVHIEIEDDGRGLDKEVLLAKGVERGLIGENDKLSEEEIFNMIFEPGFSTAKKVTDISGRGVGMDVVRRNIEALRGKVGISSELGTGSIFRMILPLTLAIIDGLVIKVGGQRFIIPVLSIVESLRPTAGLLSTVEGKGELLNLRGELLPLFRLGRLFELPEALDDPTKALVIVLQSGLRRVGIMVDELIGQQQTVIKSLSQAVGKREYLSGAAIMSDGRVGLILDAEGIMKLAVTKQNPTYIGKG
jgi:two-component system chemotaxis sensor kinase CheA